MTALQSVGMVGGGQMGEALIRGLLESGLAKAASIIVAEPSTQRREYLEKTYQIKTTESPAELAGASRVILLAVKPQVMEPVLKLYREHLSLGHLLISIAAGVTLSQMEGCLGEQMRIIRVMPNTPALVLAGASAISGNKNASREDIALCGKIFSAVGICVEVAESLLDAVTGLSGSGPAYVYTIIEALADGGVLMGLPRATAIRLAAQTVAGAAKMVLETAKHTGTLRDEVTSPGGTTIAGLEQLEAHGLRNALIQAVRKAAERSKELGVK